MIDIGLIVIAYTVGMIPNAYFLQVFINKERLGYVRSDKVGAYKILIHIKEPAFFLTLLLDLLKGAGVVFLAQWLGTFPAMPAILLLTAVIARNFNLVIGIRNGVGLSIIIGGLLVQAPLVILIYGVVSLIFYIAVRDMDTSMALGTTTIPITFGLMTESLLTIFIGFLMVITVFIHKALYIRAAALRTKYIDYKRDNPFAK